MSVVSLIARILLGLIFTLAGISPLFLRTPAPMPGVAGQLNAAFFASHWIYAIALAQFVAGVLLLTNRYVPVALVILAAFLYNSLAFHGLTTPAMLPLPIIVLALWALAALPYRGAFATLFASKA